MTKLDKKKRRDKYNIDIYGIEIHILINYTIEDFSAQYKRFNGGEITESELEGSLDCKGMQWGVLKDKENDARVCVININTSKNVDMQDIIDTMSHESFHATCSIAQYIELTLDNNSEEAYAYLCGSITRYCYKTLFKL